MIDFNTLQNIRFLMLIVVMIMLAFNLFYSNFVHFFFYETNWGFNITILMILSSIKAAEYKDWQSAAVILNEVAMLLNLAITPIWWIFMRGHYEDCPIHTPSPLVNTLHSYGIHTLPLVFSLINLALTDMVYLKADWKIVFLVGIAYIPANYAGLLDMGRAPYPAFPLDWAIPEVTIATFVL